MVLHYAKFIGAEIHLPSLSELISSSVPLNQIRQLRVHGDKRRLVWRTIEVGCLLSSALPKEGVAMPFLSLIARSFRSIEKPRPDSIIVYL